MLQIVHPRLQVLLGSPQRRALGAGLLLGLGELALQILQAPRELARLRLARAQARAQLLDLRAALALELDADGGDVAEPVLGLDPQLLLGVLALLDAPQLVLALVRGRTLGLQQLVQSHVFVLGLAQALLQARDMAFERLQRGFRGLGAARERDLATLGRPSRAAFGEQVALAATRRTRTLFPVRRLASLCHHVDGQPRGRAGRPGRARAGAPVRSCAGARPCATAATTAR